jgi:hypothetical protein
MPDIYHITHVTNLSSIIQSGGLWCDAEVAKGKVKATGIAHQHIKDRRAKKAVPLPPGGALCDYVPFYFAPRSPMLYAIHKGNVEGYQGGQNDILHLVVSVEAIEQAGLLFVFTDGHAPMAISKYYNELQNLDEIDWQVMRARYWADKLDDMDRKRRRQAEFLVHKFMPWHFITQIGVRLRTIERQVGTIIEQIGDPHKPSVIVRPDWYY